MTTANHPTSQGINQRRVVLGLIGVPLFFALFGFLPAGTWMWPRGWLFVVVLLTTMMVVFRYLWRVNPEVLIARSWTHQGTKQWDTILLWFFFPVMLAIVPVAALDSGRFRWFAVPWWVSGIGHVMLLVGIGISASAEAVNKFFEPTVRIQKDRGQRVIDTGPYAIVRHPGYVGVLFTAPALALCLGSLWALIPASLGCALLILRTQWEDQTLQEELEGYQEYTQRVRFKLIPGIW